MENILLQRDMTKPLRSLVTLGVVGGFVEPLRPGGIVFVSNGNFLWAQSLHLSTIFLLPLVFSRC